MDLLLPVVPLVLIFGGFVLPVPAAAMDGGICVSRSPIHQPRPPRGEKLIAVMSECGMWRRRAADIGTAMGLTNL